MHQSCLNASIPLFFSNRFPIDDLELLELLRNKAKEEGAAPPPDDVTLVTTKMPMHEETVLSDLLIASEFLQQFAKQLGLPPKSQVRLLPDASQLHNKRLSFSPNCGAAWVIRTGGSHLYFELKR